VSGKEIIFTDKVAQSKAPISQAVKAEGFIFCSGAVPRDPHTGELVQGNIEVQTKLVLENLKAILESAGSSLEKVLKVTVFLANREDFPGMNKVFQKYFPKGPPARSCFGVELFVDAKVEIELIALA
jgi:2-iminobutanoate/2-iminopropanoate deaminase